MKHFISRLWRGIVFAGKHLWRFLSHEETPLGVTLLLFGVTVWGTYTISPRLNETFEKQKMVSTYVTENLNNFNSLSRELISDVSVFTNEFDTVGTISSSAKEKIFTKITELQWRAIELDIIFKNTDSAPVITKYKASLDDLREAIEQCKKKKDLNNILEKTALFTESSMGVIDALAQKAGLKISQESGGVPANR